MGANHKNNMRSILLLIAFAVPAMAATVSRAAYTADTNCATITGDLQYQFDTGVCSCDGDLEPAACTKWVKYSTTGTTSISEVEYTDAECTTAGASRTTTSGSCDNIPGVLATKWKIGSITPTPKYTAICGAKTCTNPIDNSASRIGVSAIGMVFAVLVSGSLLA